jgi:hypothetical protein
MRRFANVVAALTVLLVAYVGWLAYQPEHEVELTGTDDFVDYDEARVDVDMLPH